MKSKKPRILVTGGAGYIGSVLVGALLNEGYQVRVLDNLTYGGSSLLSYLHNSRFELNVGDICRIDDLKRAMGEVWGVVHLAAIVGDPSCSRQPELARQVNGFGSEQLCSVARSNGVKRFVFASTCSNYGRMIDSNGFVDETSELNPISLYAELKVAFEQYLLQSESESFATTCLRFATAYGLSPRPRFDLTVNEFSKELALGRRLDVYGGQFWRPYCHTTDLARAIVLALSARELIVTGRVFNVGDTNENYQKRTLVEMIQRELGKKSGEVRFVQREEDPRDYRVCFARIQRELGFSAGRRVVDGIKEIVHAVQNGTIRNPDDATYSNV